MFYSLFFENERESLILVSCVVFIIIFLYVLSLFGGIVCANSTFCGWAAWSIANSGGEVVVPVPYSNGPVLGSRDFPPNWIKLNKHSGAEVS